MIFIFLSTFSQSLLTTKLIFQRFSPVLCCSPLSLYTISFFSQIFTSSLDLSSKLHIFNYLIDISLCMFNISLKLRKSIVNFYSLITKISSSVLPLHSKCYFLHIVTISTHHFPLPCYIKIHIQNTFCIPPLLFICSIHLMHVSVVSKLLLTN